MGAQDYIEPNVGGSITGYRGTANAFVNTVTEAAWTTVFVAYILYLLFLLIAPYFQARVTKEDIILESPTMEQVGRGAAETPSASTIVTPGEESAGQTNRGERFSSDVLDLGCAFRDAYLLLLGTTLLTMSGYGYGSSQMVLQWIIFGLLMLWSLTQLVTFNTLAAIIDLTAIFIVAVLAIIIWAMAFRPAVLSTGA